MIVILYQRDAVSQATHGQLMFCLALPDEGSRLAHALGYVSLDLRKTGKALEGCL